MKYLLWPLMLVSLAGCAPSSHFEIRVNGNTRFSGSIMVIHDGKSEQRSVDGVAPTSYPEEGTMVSVTFQKKDKDGHLAVEISKDGTTVGSNSTDAEYGVVSVATQ